MRTIRDQEKLASPSHHTRGVLSSTIHTVHPRLGAATLEKEDHIAGKLSAGKFRPEGPAQSWSSFRAM